MNLWNRLEARRELHLLFREKISQELNHVIQQELFDFLQTENKASSINKMKTLLRVSDKIFCTIAVQTKNVNKFWRNLKDLLTKLYQGMFLALLFFLFFLFHIVIHSIISLWQSLKCGRLRPRPPGLP